LNDEISTPVEAWIVVVKEDVLFERFGSEVEALTVAVFVESVLELKVAAFTLIVTTIVSPTLIFPRLQLTVVVDAVYVQLPTVVDDDV
jgi:hypothetical protein